MSSNLRDHLQAIYNQHGKLTPMLVVAAARDGDEVLSSRLEWDDSKAGEKYRLMQAADMIRSVKVVYAETKEGPQTCRAFTAVKQNDTATCNYMPTAEALADSFTSKLILKDAEREFRMFHARYRHLEQYRDILQRGLNDAAS